MRMNQYHTYVYRTQTHIQHLSGIALITQSAAAATYDADVLEVLYIHTPLQYSRYGLSDHIEFRSGFNHRSSRSSNIIAEVLFEIA